MRKTTVVLTLMVMAASVLSGCIYADVRAPMQAMLATEDVPTTKEGTSEVKIILGLVAWGDASVKAAMDNGGITKVHHVDTETYNILGIYTRITCHVYGE